MPQRERNKGSRRSSTTTPPRLAAALSVARTGRGPKAVVAPMDRQSEQTATLHTEHTHTRMRCLITANTDFLRTAQAESCSPHSRRRGLSPLCAPRRWLVAARGREERSTRQSARVVARMASSSRHLAIALTAKTHPSSSPDDPSPPPTGWAVPSHYRTHEQPAAQSYFPSSTKAN